MMKCVLFLNFVLFAICGASSDTAGQGDCRPTPHDIYGPYYIPRPPPLIQYCTGDPARNSMDNLIVRGKVLNYNCRRGLPRMRIEVWQADHAGHYRSSADCRGFIYTDRNGYYEFSTIHPGQYTIDRAHRMFRPSHIHFRIFGRRRHKGLVTQLYFKGDPYLGRNDSCSVCSSGDSDLVKTPREFCDTTNYCMDVVDFDIVLRRGRGESVTTTGPDDITE